MGNICRGQTEEVGNLESNRIDFPSASWELLKSNSQLSELSPESQTQIFNYILSLPQTPSIKTVSVIPQNHIYAVYKNNLYFYVGQVVNDIIKGKGALALPLSKHQNVYVGQFVNNKIQGKGSMTLKAYNMKETKNITINANWQKSIKGSIKLQNQERDFPFEIEKNKIKVCSNIKYIQYPNYDEYIGQTLGGLAHGKGRYVYRDGDINKNYPIYEGQFVNGIRQGNGILKYSQFMQLEINWTKGKPNGRGFLIIDGSKNQIIYQQGRRISKAPSELKTTNE